MTKDVKEYDSLLSRDAFLLQTSFPFLLLCYNSKTGKQSE
jgi:hypothetical protein